ncbi:MAG: hypothetical protein ACI9MR_001333 [Myxococcota bacterium]
MTLTRQQLDEQLLDYLYEELDDAQSAAFEASVSEFPDIGAEVAAHRRTRTAASGLFQAAPPVGLFDGVLEAAALSAEAARKHANPERVSWWMKIHHMLSQPGFAAGMATVLLVGVGTVMLSSGPTSQDGPRKEAPDAPALAERAPEAVAVAAPKGPEGQVAEAKEEASAPASVRVAAAPEEDRPDAKAVTEGAPEDDEVARGFGSSLDAALAFDALKDTKPTKPSTAPTPKPTATATAKAKGSKRSKRPARPEPTTLKRPAPKPAVLGGAAEPSLETTLGGSAGSAGPAGKLTTSNPYSNTGTKLSDGTGGGSARPAGRAPAPRPPAVAAPREQDSLDSDLAKKALPEVPIAVPNNDEAAQPETVDTEKTDEAERVAGLWRRYAALEKGGEHAKAEALLDELERVPSERTKARSMRKRLVATRRAKRAASEDGAKETLDRAADQPTVAPTKD